jgi:hypothetical protein
LGPVCSGEYCGRNQANVGRYGKQLLDNAQWRQECAAKVGLGFALLPQTAADD